MACRPPACVVDSRHHLPLFVVTLAATACLAWLVPSKDPRSRWRMATAYAGLVLLGLPLATGPLNVLRRRPNPVSTHLRRDVGVRAGVVLAAQLSGYHAQIASSVGETHETR